MDGATERHRGQGSDQQGSHTGIMVPDRGRRRSRPRHERLDRQQGHDEYLEALPPGAVRVGLVTNRLAAFHADELDARAAALDRPQFEAVCRLRQHLVDPGADIGGEGRGVHHEADLRVREERPRVEIHRADEDRPAIEHQHLAVQRGVRGTAAVNVPGRGLGLALQAVVHGARVDFVELDAGRQQFVAVLLVGGEYRQHVGGAQGVGEHPHPHAAFADAAQERHTLPAGHEIGRDQGQLLAGAF